MERFKVCEKETKTKAYSKDGLAAARDASPGTKKKMEARDWIEQCLESLQTQKDSIEAELEVIRSKQKKNSKGPTERETELSTFTERHNYHESRLELMLRLLDNDNLNADDIESVKDDVQYYLDSNQDPDFQEDDTIYDPLNLDDLDQDKGALDILKKEKEEKDRREREEAEREEAKKREEARKAEIEKKRKADEEKRQKEEQRRQLEAERRRQEEERRRVEQERRVQMQKQQEAAAAANKRAQEAKQSAAGSQAMAQQQQQAAKMQAQQQQQPKSYLSQFRNDKEGDNSQGSDDFRLSQEGLSQDAYAGVEGVDAGQDKADNASQLAQLEQSLKMIPDFEHDRPKAIFDNPQIFDNLDMDTLFFIFYFQTGTLQQYLAARALKKQGWRFHKKYLTWFQRHEEPVEAGYQCERGTYVYFDYETGWCQRIKTDFTFDYQYLEDEVPAS